MADYGLKLGPLAFVTALDDFVEQLGEQLEQAGPVVHAGERRARPFALTLPVRAADSAVDSLATGKALRRQVRQLMENSTWRLQGLPLEWDVDSDMSVWLMVGGGDLEEIQDGLTFGEWKLKLTDCYLVGRPGTHRAGRRLDLGDRRTGLVARDTLGRIYNTDYSAQAIPTQPLILPGEGKDLVGAGGKTPSGITAGPSHDGVVLSQSVSAIDGEVVAFETESTTDWAPDTSFAHDASYRAGAVRLWDTAAAVSPVTTTVGDRLPAGTSGYGWLPVLGPIIKPLTTFSIDNGICRVRWGGFAAVNGLVIGGWVAAGTNKYVEYTRLIHAAMTKAPIITPIEVTTERVVVQITAGPRIMRVILQRGWTGPRVESYLPGGNPTIDLATALPGPTVTAETPNWVRRVETTGAVLAARVAQSHAAVLTANTGYVIGGTPAQRWYAPEALAVQVSASGSYTETAAALAAISLVDARPVPVLTER